MAINFPNSPSDGDLYSAVGRTWQYNSTASAWESISESNVTLTGLGLPNHNTLDINSSGQIGDHLIPDTNITRDLGTATNRWRDLYLSGNSIQLGTRQITQDNVPDVNLSIAPEVLEIQVDAPDAGQATIWKWTWEQSTLPYARRTITNSNELNVPLYKEGTYVVNNFAAYDIHGSMTQTHSLYLKWIDGAGTDNLVSWATSAGPISDTHPDINGGNATDVQRITVNVPSTITLPTLTNPSVSYSVVNNGSGGYTFSGSAKGDNPNIGPFYRGGTYTVNINATGHPFYFTTDNGTNFASGTYFGEYTSGVTGSRTDSGTITFTVPAGAPDTLYYQCGNHGVMRGEITVKDLAVETNINGNYVVYFQHTQEGHKTAVELRPIPSLVNQMCLVYDSTSGKFVPQDLATYVENTPSFENKIREVAGTAELVVEDGSAVIAKVNVYDDSTYLPLTGNNPGDQAFATDTDILYIWDGTAWQQAGAANSDDLTEGSTNLFFTNERVDDRVSALIVGGNNITSTYDDTAGTLTIDGQPGYTNSDVGTYLSTNGYDTATNIVASITDSAPGTLDTLNELAAALGDDPNFATTVSTNISTKLATADFTSTANTWIGTKDTDDLTEGSTNLYYTDARADARITASDTDALSEGSTNLYYTDARADARITASDTDALSEGTTNLYYTQGRFDSAFATKISSDVTFGADVSADLVNATLLIQDDTIPNGTTYTIPSGKQVVVDSLDIIGDLDVLGTLATVSGGSLTQTTMKTQAITHTNGTNAINISTGGNVGIGTGSPTNKLTIDNGSSTGVDITSTTESYINFGTTSNTNLGQIYYSIANNRMLFRTNDYNNVYIDSNGRVGIGDANPVTSLDVRSSINTSTDWWTNGKATIFAYNTNASGDGILKLIGATGTQRIVYGLGANADKLIFSSRQAESDTSKTVVIDNNGNVGIGTVSPARQLSIVDDGTNGQAIMEVIDSTNDNLAGIFLGRADNTNIGGMRYFHSDNSLRFRSNDKDSLVIDNQNDLHVSDTNLGSQLYTQSNAGAGSGGTESNATTGWAVGYTGATIASVGTDDGVAPNTGSYQLKYTGTNNGARVDYGFAVEAGKRYQVTLNSDWHQGSLYALVYVATSASGDNLGAAISPIESLNNTTYAETKISFGATVTGTVYLSFRMASTSSPQNVTYVDNISIKEEGTKSIFAKDQYLAGDLYVNGQIKLANLASDPSAATTGGMYFNTTSGAVRVYDGSAWDQIQALTPFSTINSRYQPHTQVNTQGAGATKISTYGATAWSEFNSAGSTQFGGHDGHDGSPADYPAYVAVYLGGRHAVNRLNLVLHSNSYGFFELQGSNNSGTGGSYTTGSWTSLPFITSNNSQNNQNAGGQASGYSDGTVLTYQYNNDIAYSSYRLWIKDGSQAGESLGTRYTGWATYYWELYRD